MPGALVAVPEPEHVTPPTLLRRARVLEGGPAVRELTVVEVLELALLDAELDPRGLVVHQRADASPRVGELIGVIWRLRLGLDLLATRLAQGEVKELIIATNPTVEGEATAHYLAQLARQQGVRPSRLTHGVPLGGELEYVDRGTLSHAFGTRSEMP